MDVWPNLLTDCQDATILILNLSFLVAITRRSVFDANSVIDLNPKSDQLICHCYEVTGSTLQQTIELLDRPTLEQVTRCTDAGAGCAACHCRIRRMLAGLSPHSTSNSCCNCGREGSLCRCQVA
ncbi:MAG: hypothetical protein CMJ81_16265 [Planctomycetaceae bacterium]|nr:hypothetical protein [Planctomycetaceae bacterium]